MAQRKKKTGNTDLQDSLLDLTSIRLGTTITFATDEWFAAADNLLSPQAPKFVPDLYTPYGKWMDGWESRRKRIAGHDWCIITLGVPGRIQNVTIDTSFFTGNHSPHTSLQAACIVDPDILLELSAVERKRPRGPDGTALGTAASSSLLEKATELSGEIEWFELVPYSKLEPGYSDTCHNNFEITSELRNRRVTHLRLNMFPDGGIARLRVKGVVDVSVQDSKKSRQAPGVIDLAAALNGGIALGCSDQHFGKPSNLISPGEGVNMGDGWETARKLSRPPVLKIDQSSGLVVAPGSDWAVIRLGTPGKVQRLDIDTKHFKGNFPESCRVEACYVPVNQSVSASLDAHQIRPEEKFLLSGDESPWQRLQPILPRQKLGADRAHYFQSANSTDIISHIRLSMFPDGGISRIRLYGAPHVQSSL